MWSLSIAFIMYPTWWTLWLLILASFYIGIMSLAPSTWDHYLPFLFFLSSYIFTCQLVIGVLLILASCIRDPCLLTIPAYIKDYNPKLLVIIMIIIIIIIQQEITAYGNCNLQKIKAIETQQMMWKIVFCG